MWTPPERVKHPVSPTSWPTAEEAEASMLFAPIDVGPTRLTSRTWVPAMVPWRATENGFVTDDVLAWYRRFAEGEPAVMPDLVCGAAVPAPEAETGLGGS